jgi:ferredoxin-type protein NapH
VAGELIGDILRLTVLAGLGTAGILAILIWKKNLAMRVTFLRLVIQAVAFAAIFYMYTYSALIPMLYELIVLFAITIVLGRYFCGWLCPFALIMDIESLVRRALKIRYRIIPDRLNKALHKSRYLILLAFLLIPVLLWFLDPQELLISPLVALRLAGHYSAYSILLDPLITLIVPWTGPITVAGINLSYPYVQNIIAYTGSEVGQYLAISFVAITLFGAFFIRRAWCRFCPTGISLAAVSQIRGLRVYVDKNEEKCTKCGVCKRVCPVQVTEVYEQKGGKILTSQCMVCARCVEMCPYEDALRIKLGKKTVFRSRNWLKPSNDE